jgi:hypothetical protein
MTNQPLSPRQPRTNLLLRSNLRLTTAMIRPKIQINNTTIRMAKTRT